MNKRGRKTSFGERLVASFPSRSSLSWRDGGFPTGGSLLCSGQSKEEKSKCPLPSCPTGQAPGKPPDRQATVPSAGKGHPEPPRSVPKLLPALHHPRAGGAPKSPTSPTSGSSNNRGPSPHFAWQGVGYPLGAAASHLKCLVGGEGGCPGLGVPEGIGFQAHLRPDILSGSLAPALVCLLQPGLKCH